MNQKPTQASGGFTLVEFTLASVMLIVGVMGFAGAIVTSQVMVRATKENNLAQAALISAVEGFRLSCIQDFEGALTNSIGKTTLFRQRNGTIDADIGVRVTGNTATLPSAPVIPLSVPITSGVETIETNPDVTTSTFVYVDSGIIYSQATLTYVDGTVSKIDTRVDPDGSTATSADIVYAGGNTASVYYGWNSSTQTSVYSTTDDKGLTVTNADTELYGLYSVESDGGSTALFQRGDSLIDFTTLSKVGRDAKLDVSVLVDETTIEPPVDLNGDGDFLDTNVAAADLQAAVLRIVVTWDGVLGLRRVEYSTIIAKGEVQ